MRIAVDAMGGDFAPQEAVAGALAAARAGVAEISLVGDQERIEPLLVGQDVHGIEVIHTPEVITMHEHPAAALRRKPQASILVASRLVKEGRAAALVSAGSTGAQMAAALLVLGRIPGIQRPAIATYLPSLANGGRVLLLDVGANLDCTVQNLLDYARMGSLYAEHGMGLGQPRVALLNVGTEQTKGSEVLQQVHQLLTESELNFVGNVEGRDIPFAPADVIVCDGLLGNVVLKFAEGLLLGLMSRMQREVLSTWLGRIGGALVLPNLRRMKHALDYSKYGGAPLLGVRGISIICHGNSRADTIARAVEVAVHCVNSQLVEGMERMASELSLKEGN